MSSSRYHEAHVNPQGPGDARPTALQIVEDEGLVGKLKDKVMLITGCSSGVGIETARALHATGARLFLTVRDMQKGREVVESILADDPSNKAEISLIKMELDSFDSIRAGAADFLHKSSQLNVLICNAGVMATPYGLTRDGFETQFGTNHLGHFLLFQLLKPTLLSSSTPSFHSRVVAVSSIGHRQSTVRFDDVNFSQPGSYEPWVAYGQAKTANIWFANEIERRYGRRGLHGVSLHPGGIATGLQAHLPAETMEAWDTPSIRNYMKSPAQGAATSVFAAVSGEWEGRGGRYLSNCEEMGPYKGKGDLTDGDDGFAQHAYDGEGARRLWGESCRMVGVEDDE